MLTSLPDVQFTNNLGTILFKRCLIGVTDNWEWDGRVSRHVKSISIDGHIQQGGLNEAFTGLSTDRTTNGQRTGDLGTLVLPWTTLQNIRFNDLTFPENVWLDFIPVQATFADEFPNLNGYNWSFYGITIYNPKITMAIPERQLRDEYPQQPWQSGGLPFFIGNARVGVFRSRAGQKNMDFTVSGSVRIEDVQLPAGIIDKMTQRANFSPLTTSFIVATGYPRTFNLGDAIPEIRKDLNLAHCMVLESKLQWRVEEAMATITLQMMCPPQRLS